MESPCDVPQVHLDVLKGLVSNRKQVLESIERSLQAKTHEKRIKLGVNDPSPRRLSVKAHVSTERGAPTWTVRVGSAPSLENTEPEDVGVTLVFSHAGIVRGILLGCNSFVAEISSAAVGAMIAKYLAPRQITGLGVIGVNAHHRARLCLQLDYLTHITACRKLVCWASSEEFLKELQGDVAEFGYTMHHSESVEEICAGCNLILTMPSGGRPLVKLDMVRPGTHIMCMRTQDAARDSHIDATKQQNLRGPVLDPVLFPQAQLVVTDDVVRCTRLGEAQFAVTAGFIREDKLMDLGKMQRNKKLHRTKVDDVRITISDQVGDARYDDTVVCMAVESLHGLKHGTHMPARL